MDDIIKLLPESINTTLLVGVVFVIYKLISVYSRMTNKKKEAEEKLVQEALEKEKLKSKFEARLVDVEKQVIDVKDDLHEHAADNKEVLKGLGNKMDEILRFLIQKNG